MFKVTKMKIKTTVLLTIIFLAAAWSLSADFQIVSQGSDYTEIEFTMPELEMITVEHDGVKYTRLYHPEHGLIMEDGLPEVLSFSFLLSIPATGTVEIEKYKVANEKRINDFLLFPSQGFDLEIDEKRGFLKDKDFYAKDIQYPAEHYAVSRPGVMRDMRLVTVSINPITYNPAQKKLTMADRVSLRIRYDANASGENELTNAPGHRSRTFDRLQRSLVLNHDQFRNPGTRNDFQQRSMIVVHHHTQDQQYRHALNNFLQWKRDKGFKVDVVDTGQYDSNNAIRQYVRDAYHEWDNPPEYFVIVGDVASNISVPTFVEYQDAYIPRHVRGDHPYSLMDDEDLLADVVVGRISIGSGFQLAAFWNKLENYEKYPFMGNTDWYDHQLLVGDAREGHNNTGVSGFFTTRYIKNIMERYNSDFNYTEVYEPPFPAAMQNAINQGASFFSFRGMYGLAGWNPNENQFNNNSMPPNVSALTCRSLDFEGVWGFSLGHQFRMGTPTTSRGFMSAIGISASSDTAFNNLLTGAIFNGLFTHGMWTMGEAKVYSKYEHYRAFWNSHEWRAAHYFQMLNLKGDPTMDVWKGVPRELNADYPEELPPGSNSILITVTDADDQPLKYAWVTIRQGEEMSGEDVFATGYTNAEGQIALFFDDDVEGEVKVTVTKHQYIPHIGDFEVTGAPGVTFNQFITNDDIIAGEDVNFVLTVRNHSNQAVNGINGVISTESEYLDIEENDSAFGNIAANSNADSQDNFVIELAPETPMGHRAYFDLTLTDNADNSWLSRFSIVVNNGKLEKQQLVIDDNDDGVLDPLEEARLMLYIANSGEVDLEDIFGELTGGGYGLEIVSDTAYFGNINAGDVETSVDRHFEVRTSSHLIPGMIFDLNLHLFNEAGFSQTIPVKIPIGTVTVDDPLGPCAYGYWIYDCGDTDYMEAPVYDWFEISPALGGNGVDANITSNYDDIQQVTTMELPFNFRMYGIDYEVISICSNGWVSFAETEIAAQRNWRLPGPLGPDPIIAAFWDNLGLDQGAVYTYYDEEEHIFIIQWQEATNVQRNEEETFQIILYDPEFHFTSTRDGAIKIQYKVFNNVNNRGGQPGGPQSQYGEWGNYSTIGISDHTGLVGLEYTFNNEYPAAARPLEDESAIYITTGSLGFTPYVAIEEVNFTDGGENMPSFGSLGDLSVTLRNLGGQDAENVTATLLSQDEYVNIIDNRADFGDIDSEDIATVDDAFRIEIAENVPDNHSLSFTVSIEAEGNLNWNFRYNLSAKAPNINLMRPYIYDPEPGGNNNGILDPGEELTIFMPLTNMGGADSPEINFEITTENPLLEILEVSEDYFRHIASSQTMYPAVRVSVSDEAEVGQGIVIDYQANTGEYTFTGNVLLGIGGVVPAEIGEGDAATGVSAASPINIYFQSLRSQTVYTAEELQEAGITSGGPIGELGYWIAGAPEYALNDFVIRMRHTDAVDASNHIREPYQTVFSTESYSPAEDGWEMLELDNAFEWNGEDNILVDTAFSPVDNWSNTGQVRYYDQENGFRYTRQDSPDQTDIETTDVNNQKPQIRLLIDTSHGDATNIPQNLTANIASYRVVILNWEPVGLSGYNIYRNGVRINDEPIEETEYRDEIEEDIDIAYYYVTAVYEHGESLPSVIISVNLLRTDKPELSHEAGNYYSPFNLSITADDARIYYTLDGSEPDEESHLYDEPLEIDYHTIVKAIAYSDNYFQSEVTTAQYYILHPPKNLQAGGSLENVELSWDEPWSPDDAITAESQGRNTRLARERKVVEQEQVFEALRSERQSRNQSYERVAVNSLLRTSIVGYNIYRSTEGSDFEKINEEPVENTNYQDTNLEETDHVYYVTVVYDVGESDGSNRVDVGPTSVDEEDMLPVLETKLARAYPNPFNPETVIEFTLKVDDHVRVEIFDVSGRRVRILVDEVLPSGRHNVVWNSEDSRDKRLSSGVYFYRMISSDYSETKKVLMLK